MTMDSRLARSRDVGDVLSRAAAILDAIADNPSGSGAAEIAAAAGLPLSTAYRLLSRLQDLSLVTHMPEAGAFAIGSQAIRWGVVGRQRLEPRQAAIASMRELQRRFGETVQLSIPDGRFAVFIESVESNHTLRPHIQVGQRFPLHAGASARVMLAHAPDHVRAECLTPAALIQFGENTYTDVSPLRVEIDAIRNRGYAISTGEIYGGSIAVAAPFFDGEDTLVGVIAVSAPTTRVSHEFAVQQVAPALLETVNAVSRSFGSTNQAAGHAPLDSREATSLR
jgi:DNA-binding IclR family transcriptional regulator